MTVLSRQFRAASSDRGDLPPSAYDWEYTQPWTLFGEFEFSSNSFGMLMGKQDTSLDRGWGVFMRGGAAAPTLAARISNGGAIDAVVHTTAEYSAGTWRACSVTDSGAGVASGFAIRVDGAAQSTVTIEDTLGGATIRNSVRAQVGCRGGSAAPSFYGDFAVRRLALFNRVLTAAELANLEAGATRPQDLAGCVGWWECGPLNDGITAIADWSEQRNIMLLTGTVASTTGPTITALTPNLGTTGVKTLSGPLTRTATVPLLANQGYTSGGTTPAGTAGDQIGPGAVVKIGTKYFGIFENATGVKSLDVPDQPGTFDFDTPSIAGTAAAITAWTLINQGVAASALINCTNIGATAGTKAAIRAETSVSDFWRDATTGTWYALMHGGNNTGPRQIYLLKYTGAVDADGFPSVAGGWTIQNSGNPVIPVGAAGSWKAGGVADAYIVRSPDGYPVLDGAGRASVLFAGWDAGGAYQVGLAQSTDNFTTVVESAANPVLPRSATAGAWNSGAMYPGALVWDPALAKVCAWLGGAQSASGTAGLGIGFWSADLSDLTTWTEGLFNPVLAPDGASGLEAVGATTLTALLDGSTIDIIYRADNGVSGATGFRGRNLATLTRTALTGFSGTIAARAVRAVGALGQLVVGAGAIAARSLGRSLAQQSGGGSADLSQLPVAARQFPDWIGYNALNVPGMAAGTVFSDPVTGRRTTKLASTTYPTASADGFVHPYSSGGYQISRPWGPNSDTYTIYVSGTGGAFVLDYKLGVGIVAGSERATPWGGDLRFTFSPKVGEEHIVYYFDGVAKLHRYDTTLGVMAEAPNATFPAGGKDFSVGMGGAQQPQYIQTGHVGRWFVWMNAVGDTAYAWDSQTDTLLNVPQTALLSDLDEPHIDRNERYVFLKLGVAVVARGNMNQQYWDLATDTFSDLWGALSHPDGLRSVCAGGDINDGSKKAYLPGPLAGGRAASPAAPTGTLSVIGDDVAIGSTDGHIAGEWDQGIDTLLQYALLSHDQPSDEPANSGFVLDAGSVYKTTITYRWSQSVYKVQGVFQTDGTSITAKLAKAASRVAMVAGSWFLDVDNVTLYVWRTDGLAPDGTTHQVLPQAPHMLHEGIGFMRADGGDLRLAGHHYSFNPSVDYWASPRATISSDGRLVLFTSNMGINGGSHAPFVIETPRSTASGLATVAIAGSGASRPAARTLAGVGTLTLSGFAGTLVARAAAGMVAGIGALRIAGAMAAVRALAGVAARGLLGAFAGAPSGPVDIDFPEPAYVLFLAPTMSRHLIYKRGDTVTFPVQLRGRDRAAVDLTGARVALSLRRQVDDVLVVDHVDVPVSNASTGTIDLHTVLAPLTVTGGVYGDFVITFGDGTTLPIPGDGAFVGEIVAPVA